ncbi:hypothetical protein B6V01_003395 [Methanosarcinales archaeon ex4572_44]|nr:MAG: hypothetical protein B6V01_003395 [Methanosarcinales archaeon ex4572_44]
MTVVISIGGSVLVEDLDHERVLKYASVIKDVIKEMAPSEKVFIVTGGGKVAREYINAARRFGASEVACDFIGIEVTRLNASLARRLPELTPEELVEIVMKISMGAGSNSPVDPLAAKIIERCRIHTFVFDGTHPENIPRAIMGEHIGTDIKPKP